MPVRCGPLPPKDELLRLFSYCEATGLLTRLATSSVVKGSPNNKYVVVGIGTKTYLAHRIIWKMMTGSDANIIDHADCDGHNNKWINLRDAQHRENLRNRGAPKNNTSGAKGVSFCKATGLWRASIMVDYRCINLGRYPTIERAAEAYRIASEKMHGEFSRAA
jgi:hypothetical protein